MQKIKDSITYRLDKRLRDSFWALRTRGDFSVTRLTGRSVFNICYQIGSSLEHLESTINWLCAAQDATSAGGVSAFYDIRAGEWGPLYPETTGYIIPTFYSYADFSGDDSFLSRANRMADWLLTVQLENGAFPIGPLWSDWDRKPIVFDTGQVLHGLIHAFKRTNELRYLKAARRAGDWLVDILESDGSWRRHTSLDHVHTFNVRTSWALLLLAQVSNQETYREAAVKNLLWSIDQQDKDGWFRDAGFKPNEAPLTHTIAYTIEGLFESGRLLEDQRMINAARLAADKLKEKQEADGYLRARYDRGWQSNLTWSCLTGNAQIAGIWFGLYEITGDDDYLQAAVRANLYLKERQPRNSKLPGVSGGIFGSYPLFADYEPYRNLNWAAKFFADSLLLEIRFSAQSQNG